MKTTKKIFLWLSMLLAAAAVQDCAPVFSEMQDARLVGKGNSEVQPYFTSARFNSDSEVEIVQQQIGTQFAIGLSERIDLRLRFEYIWSDGYGYDYNEQIFGIGPKISLVKDRVAAYLPIGFAFSDIGGTFQIDPSILFTIPVVDDKVDFNPSVKYLIWTCEGCENDVALNFGLAFSNDIKKWSVRTEYGLLFNPGETGYFGQFSLGINYRFIKTN